MEAPLVPTREAALDETGADEVLRAALRLADVEVDPAPAAATSRWRVAALREGVERSVAADDGAHDGARD